MHKRFSRSSLNRFLGREAVASDAFNSHAYGKVARDNTIVPSRKHALARREKTAVPSYQDSMVGSITQYRSAAPVATRKPEEIDPTTQNDEAIVGNRPRNGAKEAPKSGAASLEKRHHFIEPPKRNFNRFD